jgi:hypothetical protein
METGSTARAKDRKIVALKPRGQRRIEGWQWDQEVARIKVCPPAAGSGGVWWVRSGSRGEIPASAENLNVATIVIEFAAGL